MRVLVTGGRGLLGGAIVREVLARGHAVTCLQRTPAGHGPSVGEVLADVTSPEAVAKAVEGMDAVIHGAARVSMVGPWGDFERVNVDGTRVVLDAAMTAGVRRFVYISSPSVAHRGHALVGAEAGVADPGQARGNYARSKAQAELLALARSGPRLSVVAVRPHLVWGPGDTQLIAPIAHRAARRRLVLVDEGAALIDTTYVDNAATAIAQALERCDRPDVAGAAFVVSNGEPRTVAELVGRITRAVGADPSSSSVRHIPFPVARAVGAVVERAWEWSGRAGEPAVTAFIAEQLATAHWFDQRRTRAALDWRPQVSLDEGWERLATWYAEGVRNP